MLPTFLITIAIIIFLHTTYLGVHSIFLVGHYVPLVAMVSIKAMEFWHGSLCLVMHEGGGELHYEEHGHLCSASASHGALTPQDYLQNSPSHILLTLHVFIGHEHNQYRP